MMRPWFAVAALFLLAAGPAPGLPDAAQAAAIVPQRLPGLALGVGGEVLDLDAVRAPGGALVACALVRAEGASPASARVLVWRRDGAGPWSAPTELAERPARGLRLVATRSSVVLVTGPSIAAWSSDDDGRHWSAIETGVRDRQVQAFDACAMGDAWLLVTLGMGGDVRVCRLPGGEPRTLPLTAAPAAGRSAPPALRLAGSDTRVLLLVADAAMAETRTRGATGGAVKRYQATSRLRATESVDAGASWSPPSELSGPAGAWPAPILDVTALSSESGALVVVASGGLHAITRLRAGAWSAARRLSPSGTDVSRFSATSVRVAGVPPVARMAWIDARRRHTDRSRFLPFGGLPWSDQPDWPDNDAFACAVADLQPQPLAARVSSAAPLTPELSYAHAVRLVADRDGFVAMWAGRDRVGKQLDSARRPPEVFFAKLVH